MGFKEQILEINTNEQWERLVQLPELIVVDIYSECFGPCAAMFPNLKQIKQRVRDNLHLARAKCDNITFLEQFREKSEPTWMFLVEGKIVNIMYGANAPKLIRIILDELNNETAVKAGKHTRSELDINNLPKTEILKEEVFLEEPKEDEKPVQRNEDLLYFPFGFD